MGPGAHGDEADPGRGRHQRDVAKEHLAREHRDDLRGEAEARQDQDVDLRVAEEPEEVLPHDGGRARLRVEEVRAQEAVEQQHDLGRRERGRMIRVSAEIVRISHTKTGMRPSVIPGPRMVTIVVTMLIAVAIVPDPGDQDREVPVVGRVPGREGPPGERGVGEPPDRGGGAGAVEPVAADEAEVKQESSEQQDPEPEGVQPREGEVAGPDHQGHQVVAEPEHDRDPDQEHHGRPVHGEEPVERLRGHHVEAGPGQLEPHHRRLEARDDQEDEPGGHVHDPQPLVVDRDHPLVEQRQHRPARLGPVPGRHRSGQNAHGILLVTAGSRGTRSPRPRRHARASWPA